MLIKSFRVRGHAFATIESLDEWPGVKVGLLHYDTERLVSHLGSCRHGSSVQSRDLPPKLVFKLQNSND